jgi:hypothetical protein
MRRQFHLDPMLTFVLASVGISCGGQTNSASGGGRDTADASGPGGAGMSGSGGRSTGGSGGMGTSDSGGALERPPIGVCTHGVVGDGSWTTCDEGFEHRAARGACTTTVPRGPVGSPPDAGFIRCVSDSECSYLLYGHCAGGRTSPTYCAAGCAGDDDCSAGDICFCASGVAECIHASCSVDADCGPGSLCATYEGIRACATGIVGVACQKPEDECVGSECADPASGFPPACQLEGNSRRCLPGVGGCGGRPFLVQGRERVADVAVRADWLETKVLSVRTRSLSDRERARCAEHWTRMAQMEHASIAAFARFSLELLALGAPADLVADAARAMSDEQRHAMRCFALASAYAGDTLGPEALSIDGALVTPTLESVLETTLLEGCIGELVATAEARESAGLARDPFVRRTLSEIADDESRHAALGWRFLGWAIERGGAPLLDRARHVASLELQCARAAAAKASLQPTFDDSSALGILPEALRARLRAEVLARVVVPALDAMLASRMAA